MRFLEPEAGRLPHILLVAAAVIASRFNSLFNGFVQDGNVLVAENPFVKGWENVPFLFQSGYWAAIGKTGGLYRPLTLLSYLAEYSISGLNPLSYHAVNLILHILCSVLVYLLLERLLGDRAAGLAGSLVFAVHPVLTEIVATVHGRAELLSVFFILAGLLVFILAAGRYSWLAVSAVMMLLGLMSKETAVVLPLLVLLYLVVFERERRGSSLKSIAVSLGPYILALAAYMAMRVYAIHSEQTPPPESVPLVTDTGYVVFLTMMKALAHYIRLSSFPTDLLIIYDFPRPSSILNPAVCFSLAVLCSFVLFARRIMRYSRGLFFFSSWFIAALLPVSNIIPIGIIMSERAMYLPLVSFCALAGFAYAWLLRWAGGSGRSFAYVPNGLLAVILVSLSALSLQRAPVWKTQELFFTQVLHDYKRYADMYPGQRAKYLESVGETYLDLDRPDEAVPAFKEALELDPEFFPVHTQLAMLYDKQDMAAQALEFAESAYSLSGGADDRAMGVIASSYFNMGRRGEAEEAILKAISLKPDRAEHYINYGLMLKYRGDMEGALASMEKAAELQPTMPDTHYRLGLLLGEAERFAQAAEEIEKSVSLRPFDPTYHYYLAVAYYGLGEQEKAASELEAALELKPDYTDASRLIDRLR